MIRRKPLKPAEELTRLETRCATQEMCTYEAMTSLRRRGVSESIAEKIVARLCRDRFIDDSRFSRAYVREKVLYCGWGRRKVNAGLSLKRIPRDIAREAWEGVSEEEYEQTARRVLRSKSRQNPALCDTYEGKQKLLRFALSRGFETDLSIRIINELKDAASAD